MTAQLDPSMTPLMYEVREVCGLTRLGATKVRELIKSGELPSVRVGARVLVRDSDLRAYVDGLQPNRTPAPELVA